MWKAALLALVPGLAFGQNLTSIDMTGQPLLYLKNGQTEGCGVRIIGGVPALGGEWRMFDVSVNLWFPGLGMVKGTTYDTTPKDISTGKKPKQAVVQSVWIKVPGMQATAPVNGLAPQKGEDGFSQLYGTSLETALEALMAQQEGKPLLVGIRRVAEPGERIYSGLVKMTSGEQEQLAACISEVVARIQESIGSVPAPKSAPVK